MAWTQHDLTAPDDQHPYEDDQPMAHFATIEQDIARARQIATGNLSVTVAAQLLTSLADEVERLQVELRAAEAQLREARLVLARRY